MKKPEQQINLKSFGWQYNSMLSHLFKVFYLIGELVMVNLAIIISFYLVSSNKVLQFELSLNDYVSTIPILLLLSILYIDYLGMTQFFRKTYTDVFISSFIFGFLSILSTSTIAYFAKWFLQQRYVLIYAGLITVVLSFIWSGLCLRISKAIYQRGKLLIIATSQAEADWLFNKIQYELSSLHLDYIGYIVTTDLALLSKQINLSTEVMMAETLDEKLKSDLLLYCSDHDKTIYVVPKFSDLIFSKFRVLQFYDMPTFMIDSLGLTFQQRLFKRVFDFIFSLLVLLITLPFQLIIFLLIKLNSRGPAIFKQERSTLDGKTFLVYKFRTMVDEAEAKFGDHLSTQNDPRVTRLGKFLRDRRLDELPQFLNILLGDMSVVGPRPERPTLISEIEERVPGFTQRLKVKAGLTGLAQVYGKYDTKPEDKLRFDMMYIRNYSFLMDMRIIIQTIQAILPSNIYSRKITMGNFAATGISPDNVHKEDHDES